MSAEQDNERGSQDGCGQVGRSLEEGGYRFLIFRLQDEPEPPRYPLVVRHADGTFSEYIVTFLCMEGAKAMVRETLAEGVLDPLTWFDATADWDWLENGSDKPDHRKIMGSLRGFFSK
jgi:hypothetical protein